MEYWGNSTCFNGTDSLYTEEERPIIALIGTMVAQYECFRDGLMDACFGDENDVLDQCVANSTTGDKIEDAFDTCFEETQNGSERSLAKHLEARSFDNTETTECYDYNTTMNWIYHHYEGDMCVLNDMGWFLNNGTTGFNLTQFSDDINGLPAATAQVSNLL